jgi:hypothetical protein
MLLYLNKLIRPNNKSILMKWHESGDVIFKSVVFPVSSLNSLDKNNQCQI